MKDTYFSQQKLAVGIPYVITRTLAVGDMVRDAI